MKKLVALLLALVMVLGMTACAGESETTTDNNNTTSTVEIARYAVYTVKITGRDIAVIPGTPGVVWPIRCRREGESTFWHIAAVGEPGTETGLYPAGGGSKIFTARVK